MSADSHLRNRAAPALPETSVSRALERYTAVGLFRCQHWIEVEGRQCLEKAKRGTHRCPQHPEKNQSMKGNRSA